ncbi:MAG: hypothetical protein IKN43_03335 [Selenomonadaceae bacterium]|nr:hypothetical protein [Selenomonadaceae bacterium]
MSDLKSLKDAFVEILLEDKGLLAKPEELTKRIEPLILNDTPNMRSFQTLQKALSYNIGENILAAMEDDERLQDEIKNAKRSLQQTGMTDSRIEDVLGIIEAGVSAVKEKQREELAAIESESFSVAAVNLEKETDKTTTEDFWFCQNCGAKNTGKFCSKCGTSKEGVQPQSGAVNSPTVNTPPIPQPQYNPPNTAPQSYQPQYTAEPQPKKSLSGAMIAVIAVIATLLVGFAIQSVIGDTKVSKNNAPQTTAVEEKKPETKTVEKKKEETPKPAAAPGELAFGEIYIGQSEGDVKRILGSANSVTTPNDPEHIHHKYDDLTVVITRGVVTGFISGSKKYATKRGIYEGVTQAEVINKYGKSDHAFNASGYDIIMEYPFTSESNRPCLLRFAIKNGVVDYISSRIWTEEENRKNERNPEKAKQVFVNYHNLITNRNFNAAFNTFTKDRKARYKNSAQTFSQGYGTTLSSEVIKMSLISSNDSEATFSYRLIARDREGMGVIRRTFDGKVTMRFEDGEWRVAETESKKVDERRE